MIKKMKKETILKVSAEVMNLFSLLILPFGFVSAAFTVRASEKELVGGIFKLLGWIAAIFGLVYIGRGVFKIAISGGDPKSLSEGKQEIIWGGIGIILGVTLTQLDAILGWFGITIGEPTSSSSGS
jgi:hypothetical protein